MNSVKKISFMGLAALFLLNFGQMADMVIIPAADAIYKEFSGAPIGLLNFILTGAQLIAIASSLLVVVFMRHFSKKTIMIALFSLFIAASCLGAAVKNLYYIAAMRAVVGFSIGGLVPAAMALINEFYHDDEKRCSMLIGNFSAATGMIGAVMTVVAGWLCSIRWDFVFYEYLAAIPILVLMIIFIPRTPPEKEAEPGKEESVAAEKMPVANVAALIGSLFVVGILFCFMAYQCSMYVVQTGLGTSVFTGALSGVVTVAPVIACVIFSAIYTRIKRGTAVLIYVFLALGFIGGSFVLNQAWTILCFGLLGFGYGLAMAYFYMHATVIAPPSKASFVLCLVTADVGLGTFLSSYFSTILMNVFKYSKLISLLPIYAGIAVTGGILSIILTIRGRNLAAK